MYMLYLDESGEFGVAPGSSDFFLVAVLSTDEAKPLKNRMRKQKKRLHDLGWPKDIEIKGTTLFRSHLLPRIPREISDNRVEHASRIIRRILDGPVLVHYAVCRKSEIARHLKEAPYGIAYNYFTGTLLCRAYHRHFAGPLTLTVDQRSKETHDKLTFASYVRTRLITDCEHVGELHIHHRESHDVLGLQAVDFISWGLFRHYEHNDERFRELIRPSVGYLDSWYARK